VSDELVQADVSAVMSRLAEVHPVTNTNLTARSVSLLDSAVAGVRRSLYVLLGAVGFLLLIACANVSNLLLTRSASRLREWSVRGALGAGRRRLLRQIITENLVLTLAGGLLGVGLAFGARSAFLSFLPSDLPRVDDVVFDWRVLGAVTAFVLLVGVGFGAIMAGGIGRSAPVERMRAGARDTGGRSARGLRRGMIVIQVAVSLVLLAGAASLGRTFLNLTRVEPGVAAEGVLTATVNLPRTPYRDMFEFAARVLPGISQFYDELTQRLAAHGSRRASRSKATHPRRRAAPRRLSTRAYPTGTSRPPGFRCSPAAGSARRMPTGPRLA
jgi:hypothetical protein